MRPVASDFAGRRALVTGASGIGGEIAARLLDRGARVCVVDRSGDALDALLQRTSAAACHRADLSSAAACQEAVRHALGVLHGLDVLINVAGMSGRRYGDGPVHEATEEGWNATLDNNAKSTFFMCGAAVRPMMEQGSGAIVNTSSVLAYAPDRTHFATHAYAAAKGAILSLTTSMASYYAPKGVRVNAVAPGLIATPMSERAQEDPAVMARVAQRQPLTGAPGTVADVAEAALWLASDAAGFVTGTVLEVAGGWSVSS